MNYRELDEYDDYLNECCERDEDGNIVGEDFYEFVAYLEARGWTEYDVREL